MPLSIGFVYRLGSERVMKSLGFLNPDYTWCQRKGKQKGFWIHKDVCRNYQLLSSDCPKACKEKEEKE